MLIYAKFNLSLRILKRERDGLFSVRLGAY